MKELLIITPPFTQLNTPYPATAYIKGFLNLKDITSFQSDLGIEVILALFSKQGMEQVFHLAEATTTTFSDNAKRIFNLKADYIALVEEVIAFLQGHRSTLARQICTGKFLPQASRFEQLESMEWAFGSMGIQDKAKHIATLFLEDISDFIVECVDPHFGFSRYAERLGRSANDFEDLYAHLQSEPTYIQQLSLNILRKQIETHQPKLICFSVPFPGNLFSALRCGQFIKQHFPEIKVAMGGGFPNTELRDLKEPRVFDFVDFITLDDGELPLELLVSNLRNPAPTNPDHKLFRKTWYRENGEVVYNNFSLRKGYKQAEVGTPDYSDLLLDQYISVIEIANPMHSLWSDGRWNKLTMAHGCYWGKCTFCDISLDYIKNYEPVAASMLVDRMEEMISQTGETGFHFVDEAAPPALMGAVALEILRRKLTVSWWTNIRFEKSFTRDLCQLLHASGCIAVSGGLEVASDRLLALIQKGVTVAQVAQVTHFFTDAGIMVHAYLMYGYPTQTVQETVDSLEMVRQLFEAGVLKSGFWHQFALTAHSPIGLAPAEYGIIPKKNAIVFANNDIDFVDSTGIDHNEFSYGLKKSLLNYMHGMCFDYPLQKWFETKIPRSTVPRDFIQKALSETDYFSTKSHAKIVWLGGNPEVSYFEKSKRGQTFEMTTWKVPTKTGMVEVSMDKAPGDWLLSKWAELSIHQEKRWSFPELRADFEATMDDFDSFWHSKGLAPLRRAGLLAV